MALASILKQIEIDMVNDEYLFGESITYTRLNGVDIPLNINGVPQTTDDKNPNIVNDPDLVVSDSMMFLSVNLTTGVPIEGDKITYEGVIWYVRSYLRSNNELYDILCTRNRRHTGSRSQRVR